MAGRPPAAMTNSASFTQLCATRWGMFPFFHSVGSASLAPQPPFHSLRRLGSLFTSK